MRIDQHLRIYIYIYMYIMEVDDGIVVEVVAPSNSRGE
jgi:hypothetical protein